METIGLAIEEIHGQVEGLRSSEHEGEGWSSSGLEFSEGDDWSGQRFQVLGRWSQVVHGVME